MTEEASVRSAARIRVTITEEPLHGFAPFRGLGAPSDGAVLAFEGRVRETNEGRSVARLDYEAYREMAEAELRKICEEAAARHEVGGIVAAHRVGRLGIGEVSVAIGVAAPHRAACYEASRYVIEEVKARLPVWKREHYEDGTSTWVGAPRLEGAEAEG